MSATIIIAVVFILICLLYGLSTKYYYQKDNIVPVEAGKIEDCAIMLNPARRPSRLVKLDDGSYINSHDYVRIVINGRCMEPRNILNGEEWLVKPIDKNLDVLKQISPKDVLLIYLQDTNIYKIREYERVNRENGELLDTFYYQDGRPHKSSRPHSKKSIVGIVKYSI